VARKVVLPIAPKQLKHLGFEDVPELRLAGTDPGYVLRDNNKKQSSLGFEDETNRVKRRPLLCECKRLCPVRRFDSRRDRLITTASMIVGYRLVARCDTHFVHWAVRELSNEEAAPFQREIDKLPKDGEAAAIEAIKMICALANAINRCPSTPAVLKALRELNEHADFQRLIHAAER
jgi:hypothetical protein